MDNGNPTGSRLRLVSYTDTRRNTHIYTRPPPRAYTHTKGDKHTHTHTRIYIWDCSMTYVAVVLFINSNKRLKQKTPTSA